MKKLDLQQKTNFKYAQYSSCDSQTFIFLHSTLEPPQVERQLSSSGKDTHLKWKENFPRNGKPSDYHMLCLGNDSKRENAPVV